MLGSNGWDYVDIEILGDIKLYIAHKKLDMFIVTCTINRYICRLCTIKQQNTVLPLHHIFCVFSENNLLFGCVQPEMVKKPITNLSQVVPPCRRHSVEIIINCLLSAKQSVTDTEGIRGYEDIYLIVYNIGCKHF